MKKYIQALFAMMLFTSFAYTHADITHESCTTGTYASYYGSLGSCDTCGFHDTRFYRGRVYGLWDYFVNVNRKNYLVSTNSANSYARIHPIQATVNFTQGNYVGSNTTGLTANYLPDTAGINGVRDAVIFLLRNVSWNQDITNRNTPIGLVEYNLRHYEITSTGSSNVNTAYAYLMGTEVLNPANGLYDLQTTWITSNGVKNYDPTPLNHKECYVMLGSWCGDGVIDAGFGETCDNGAANGTFGNACTATCQPRTCANGGVFGTQTNALTGTTVGLCQSGVTMTSFTGTRIGNTTNYSWMCDGLAGTNCSASWISTCANGGVSGNQSSVVLPTTPGLCQSGVTLGSFTGVTVGNTTNYSWTCDGYTGPACTASYSTTLPQCENGGVGGRQSSPISSGTSGLCQSGSTISNFVSSTSGRTTSYSWSCNGLSGGNCSASYTRSGGGSSSSDPKCYNMYASNTSGSRGMSSTFTCNGSSSIYTIDIRDTTSGANTLLHTFTNTGGTFTFNRAGSYTARCYVGASNATSSSCYAEINVGGGGSGGYCGDGNIGNYDTTGEMCDFGTGVWPNWCDKSTCKIVESTKPGAYNLRFEPEGDILLGDGMSIFGNLATSFATFTNNTESDVYIPGRICVYKNNKSYNVIRGNNICSSNEVGFVGKKGGVKKVGINNNQFVADTSSIPAGRDYGEAEIITTLEGLQNVDTFLKAILNIRVAKSSVNTLGGGASLLNGSKFSDVNTLSSGGFSLLKPEYNRNLILSSLGVSPLSSYVKTTSNTTDIALTKQQGNKELSSFDKIENNLVSHSLSKLPTEKFNDLENVYIHKGNVTLSSQAISGGNKTYIIENGDLTINGNIASSNNVLFVVKNGNIIISNAVTSIDAILINIGGNINGESSSTLNRLTINGALYGNVGDLLSKRTYIKDRGAYVDVGTNINFTSKIFDSPPPLLSKFLSEYTEVEKIPK